MGLLVLSLLVYELWQRWRKTRLPSRLDSENPNAGATQAEEVGELGGRFEEAVMEIDGRMRPAELAANHGGGGGRYVDEIQEG